MPPYVIVATLLAIFCMSMSCVLTFTPYVRNGDDSIDDVDFYGDSPSDVDQMKVFNLISNYLKNVQQRPERELYDDIYPLPYQSVLKRFSPSHVAPRMEKRKIFWQPLGYLPGGSSGAAVEDTGSGSGTGRKGFRYG